jgi:hypothetical protein
MSALLFLQFHVIIRALDVVRDHRDNSNERVCVLQIEPIDGSSAIFRIPVDQPRDNFYHVFVAFSRMELYVFIPVGILLPMVTNIEYMGRADKKILYREETWLKL